MVRLLRGHTKAISTVAFSPDSTMIVTSSLDGTVRVWDTRTGRSIAILGQTDQVSSAVFSPNGQWVAASGTDDGTTHVWETHTWTNVAVLHGSTYEYSVAFSPDSRLLAVGNGDFTAQLWETGTWRTVTTLQGLANAVTAVAFSPDNKWVVVASADQTARLYSCDVCGSPAELLRRAAAYVTRQLTSQERALYLHS